jgi:multidrug resistance efflux pump
MKPLPAIPTPPARRWREFRIRYLPFLVFFGVAAFCLSIWNQHLTPPGMVGQVEGPRAVVASQLPGTVAKLTVTQFSRVRAGDQIAQVITTDPKVLESSLAVVRAEIELLRVSTDPVLNKERNAMDYERLRISWLDTRSLLAVARVRLQFAESELDRVSKLYVGQGSQTNLASRMEYEIALRERDSLKAEIAERSQTVTEVERSLERLKLASAQTTPAADSEVLRASIALQEQKLKETEALMSPISLTAPLEGIVSMVYRRSGEQVAAMEPIAVIVSEQAERIVAYAIPPIPQPSTGTGMEVRKRSVRRELAQSKVTVSAPYLDLVPPTLFVPGTSGNMGLNSRPLSGLNAQSPVVGAPFVVAVPAGLNLRPGELVDLNVVSAKD